MAKTAVKNVQLHDLRQLAKEQRFGALLQAAESAWRATNDLTVLPLLALAKAHLGDINGAGQALEKLPRLGEGLNLEGRLDQAHAYILSEKIEMAAQLLEATIVADPDNPLALARLAYCRLQMGQIDEARTLNRRAVELDVNFLSAWASLAGNDLSAGDPVAAQVSLDHAQTALSEQRASMDGNRVAVIEKQLSALQLRVWVTQGQFEAADTWLEIRRLQADMKEESQRQAWLGEVIGYATVLRSHDLHAHTDELLRRALKVCPDDLSLLANLANLAEAQGRKLQALQLLRRSLRLCIERSEPAERQVELLIEISHTATTRFEKQAREAAQEADKKASALKPSIALSTDQINHLRLRAKNAMAQVESSAGNFEAGERLYTNILAESPNFLPALQGLGQQELQRGRIEESIALFERVEKINPAMGLAALISVRKIPEDTESLIKLEYFARQRSLMGSVQSGLMFQLAAAWEKHKDFDRAMNLAKEANEASKLYLRYDPKHHRQRCARIRHAFSKALFKHREDCGYIGENESLPIFVLGMPRSGTTLVEQILAGHSQIFGAGELGVIPGRIQGLSRWERHVGSGRDYPDCVDDLDPKTTKAIAAGIIEELQELAQESKPAAQFIVDKLPHNFENIGLIKFLFPKAKIISVRRDPRDIAISNYFTDYAAKHGGMGFAYDLEWIGQQLADHNLLMHHWNQLFPGQILEINYEEVVDNTEQMACKMLEYIGVEFEPQVLNFNELDRSVKTASVWQVRQPIYQTSKAKWTKYSAYLESLILGTNSKIAWEPIIMERFPKPGMFTNGIDLYNGGKIEEAEYELKKVLHLFPEHAAANFIIGLICVRRGDLASGIELMEKSYKICSWNASWCNDLIRAYNLFGDFEKAQSLEKNLRRSKLREEGLEDPCAQQADGFPTVQKTSAMILPWS